MNIEQFQLIFFIEWKCIEKQKNSLFFNWSIFINKSSWIIVYLTPQIHTYTLFLWLTLAFKFHLKTNKYVLQVMQILLNWL